jgi:hypothetical protein
MPTAPVDPAKRKRRAMATSSPRGLFVVPLASSTEFGRLFGDITRSYASDLGGVDGLTEAKRELIRRAATMEIWLQRAELRMASDQEVDMLAYATISNSQRRILSDIGLDRRSRPVDTISPLEYGRRFHQTPKG